MKSLSLKSKSNKSSFTAFLIEIIFDYSWLKLLFLALVLPVSSLFSQVETKIVSVEKFTKLKVCKDYGVILVGDQPPSVSIEGLKKDIEKVKIQVKDGELKLTRKGFLGTKRKVFIYIGVDSLSSIKATNDAIVESSGTIHSFDNLKLKARNDARIFIQTDAKRVLTDSGFYSEILVKLIADKIRSNSEYDPKSRIISQLLVAENK